MKIVLDPGAVSPAHQIAEQIRGFVGVGLLGAGERLPSVRQLASDLQCAPGTVAKAYRSLEQEGVLVTRRGGGTRVAEGAALVPSSVTEAARRYVEACRESGTDMDTAIRVLRAMW